MLAVDGGNSKTDLALRARRRRGARARPRAASARRTTSGSTAASRCSSELLDEAAREPASTATPVAEVGQLLLAGARPPGRGARAARRASTRAAGRDDDRGRQRHVRACCAPAPSAAGASPWSAAPGINCVGVGARRPPRALPGARRDHRRLGRRLRRRAAPPLCAAARSEDGRGPRTRARAAPCPRTSASRTPRELAEAIHLGRDRRSGAASSSRRWCSPQRGRRRGRGRDRRPPGRRDRRVRARRAATGSTCSAEPVEVLLGGGIFRARRRARCSTRSAPR